MNTRHLVLSLVGALLFVSVASGAQSVSVFDQAMGPILKQYLVVQSALACGLALR